MRLLMAYVLSVGFLFASTFDQDGRVPKDLESPDHGRGTAKEFLKSFIGSKKLQQKREARHAALLLLEQSQDTSEYLQSGLAAILRDDLEILIIKDLEACAWADVD